MTNDECSNDETTFRVHRWQLFRVPYDTSWETHFLEMTDRDFRISPIARHAAE
jgi:hypothetical protein